METAIETDTEKIALPAKLRCEQRPHQLDIDMRAALDWLSVGFWDRYNRISDYITWMKENMEKLEEIKECGADNKPSAMAEIEKRARHMMLDCTGIIEEVSKILDETVNIYRVLEKERKNSSKTGGE